MTPLVLKCPSYRGPVKVISYCYNGRKSNTKLTVGLVLHSSNPNRKAAAKIFVVWCSKLCQCQVLSQTALNKQDI